MRRVKKNLEILPATVEQEFLRLCYLKDCSPSSEDKKTNKIQSWEVSIGKECISCWTADDVCYALLESLSTLCLCLKTLAEIEIKVHRLNNLIEFVEEI